MHTSLNAVYVYVCVCVCELFSPIQFKRIFSAFGFVCSISQPLIQNGL